MRRGAEARWKFLVYGKMKTFTEKQKRLAENHGTPEQFEKAVWKAYADLMITFPEALEGIVKYKDEWKQAGEPEQRGIGVPNHIDWEWGRG